MTRGEKVISFVGAAVILSALAISTLFYVMKDRGGDFSGLPWTQAFDKLCQEMAEEYAFTAWKGIDWEGLGGRYRPIIEKAQAEDDFDSYYLALHAFLDEIPDGHVRADNIEEVDKKYTGGGFGFSVAELEDGRVILTWIDEESAAWSAGLRPGAELTEWNGKPISTAVDEVSTALAGSSATDESRRIKKVQYLTRAPIGSQVSITWREENHAVASILTLTAYDDGGLSLKKSYPDSVLSDKVRNMYLGKEDSSLAPKSVVETQLLQGNIYYARLWAEMDADLQGTGTAPSTVALVRQAVQQANEQGCIAMILDIRNNMGGLDEMSAEILGSFYSTRSFYEYQSAYDPDTHKWILGPIDNQTGGIGLYIEPAQEQFIGPIVALINQKCVSSGEGIALKIKELPNGETLGFWGTSGSFGLVGSGPGAKMPGGIRVYWPTGQSLDEPKTIQLDSRNGVGGVSPSIRIPMTEENALRVANGEDVELEAAVNYLSSQASGSQ